MLESASCSRAEVSARLYGAQRSIDITFYFYSVQAAFWKSALIRKTIDPNFISPLHRFEDNWAFSLAGPADAGSMSRISAVLLPVGLCVLDRRLRYHLHPYLMCVRLCRAGLQQYSLTTSLFGITKPSTE